MVLVMGDGIRLGAVSDIWWSLRAGLKRTKTARHMDRIGDMRLSLLLFP